MLFFSAFLVALSGAIMPGPVMTYTIEQSLVKGRYAGLIIIIGHAVLEIALIILILLGFGIILKTQLAQIIIGLVGGVLLAYMGLSMIHAAVKNKPAATTGPKRQLANSMIVSGFLLSALNPYFIFWWAVVGLSFIIQSYDTLGYVGVLIYFLGHICADFILYGSISFVVGSAKKFIQGIAYRIIIAGLGCVMLFFGARFFVLAIISII
ncbi:MAG: LysE family transporter [Bacteroidales bacterium]|nr:LysE family transporter [Bacteroidales bacterium]